MTRTAKSPAAVGAANRAGEHIPGTPRIVALPSAPRPGLLAWRRARGLLTISDYTRPDVAARPSLSYPESVADTSVARFRQDRKSEAHNAPPERVFSCLPCCGGMPIVFMVGCMGSPSGESASSGADLGGPVHPTAQFFAKRRAVVSETRGDHAMSKHTPGASAPTTADEFFEAAFHPYREPRSDAYKAGVLAALRYRLGEAEHVECPYRIGTAEADAFHAGAAEGHALARNRTEVTQ